MRRTLLVVVICVAVSLPWIGFSQGVSDFYRQSYPSRSSIGFRAGVNYSFPAVTAAVVRAPLATSFLGGIEPRYGYYVGGFLTKNITSTPLTFRLDATLQMKAVGSSYLGNIVRRSRYVYMGLSPQLGVNLTNKLTVYSGLEANLLVDRQNSWGPAYPLEIGTALRFAYTFGAFRVEAGYFRGFNKFDRFELYGFPGGPGINDFYNQNLQVGLLYNLGN